MESTVLSQGKTITAEKLQKIFLICGILSSLLYLLMNIFVPLLYEGYSSVTQTISELSAIGAPTRTLWVWLGAVYTLFVIAFGIGVWLSAGQNRPLKVVGLLMFVDGIVSIVWPFAPMHTRDVLAAGGGTLSDTMHIVISAITVLLFIASLGFGATAFGKTFRIYSIVTLVVLFIFGALTFRESPGIAANLPTPGIGVWERINIGVFMLWQVVLAAKLLRNGGESG